MIPGMGKGIATAILIVAYTDRYGVWNATSESALKHFGFFPEFHKGATSGEQYQHVNSVLVEVTNSLQLDLWTLDALWGWLHEKRLIPG